ncbi:MAG: Rieske 2Fe-2S domain-containing protein [Chloroflexota bacterium]
MLSVEQNERLTQVGPGTPAGELLRRYWMPVAPKAEVDEVRVKPVRLLGEDLVVYRDARGRYGLIGEHCPHRFASFAYGRIDDDGIRCPYHGWKFDLTGACLDQPAEPKGSTYKDAVRQSAYPVTESGGLLFAYLGPAPAPLIPRFDVLARPDWVRRIEIHPVLECNWVQPMENSVDPAHLYWLHGYAGGAPDQQPDDENTYEEFDFGIYKSHLNTEEIETHPLVFPNILRGPGFVAHFRVPMDDTHTRIFYILYNPTDDGGPANQEQVPYSYIGPIKTPYDDHGYTRYRHRMDTFAGQDGMAWETQGPVTERANEHLAVSDAGIILFRKMLDRQITAVAEGQDPLGTLREPHEVINFIVRRLDRHTGESIPWKGQVGRSFARSVSVPVA